MLLSRAWDYIATIAEKRLRHNKTSWHVEKYGDRLEIMGAAGELAARRFLGLSEDLHARFDDGTDFKWRGYRVDVKTTLWTPKVGYRYLQWPADKPLKADILFLVAVNLDTQEAAPLGFAYRQEVYRAPINQERAIPCHEIAIRDLHPIRDLFLIQNLDGSQIGH